MKITRLLIGISCAVLTALIQLWIRPSLRGINSYLDIILGSLPNFLAVLGFSFILIHFKKAKQKTSSSMMAAFLGIIAHEIFTQSTPSGSFGGMFDWYDIIASALGGMFAYLIEKHFLRIQNS
ncbi:hypothetical protein [Spirosoma panaciterrae]|uniref:hypothetical protein n=1 Tax=Spirosoma panaciterrae TaxID=496058 RepID=UPI0012FA9B6A|nr:hypothetical protein [Spirosoma panaciterrae]